MTVKDTGWKSRTLGGSQGHWVEVKDTGWQSWRLGGSQGHWVAVMETGWTHPVGMQSRHWVDTEMSKMETLFLSSQ